MLKRLYMRAMVAMFKLRAVLMVFSIPREVVGSLFFAVAVGYNELARQQTDIKRRAMCRMMREATVRSMLALGLTKERLPFQGNPIVLEIGLDGAVPGIEFRESDWELMRKALAEHDARKADG